MTEWPDKNTWETIRALEKSGGAAELMHAAELREAFGYAPSPWQRKQEEDRTMNDEPFDQEVEIMDIGDLRYRLIEVAPPKQVFRLEIGDISHTPLRVVGQPQALVQFLQRILHELGATPEPAVSEQLQRIRKELEEIQNKVGLSPAEVVVGSDQVADAVVQKMDETYALPRKRR